MSARYQLPGVRWFLWLRSVCLRTGTLTGIYISCLLVTWLVVANRVPELEPYAGIRNLVAGSALVVLAAIPILRFRNQPARLFLAGLVAWTILTVTYIGAEFFFALLKSRMGALHVFMLGVVSYGIVAVFQWVFLICVETRIRHVEQSHQIPAVGSRRQTH